MKYTAILHLPCSRQLRPRQEDRKAAATRRNQLALSTSTLDDSITVLRNASPRLWRHTPERHSQYGRVAENGWDDVIRPTRTAAEPPHTTLERSRPTSTRKNMLRVRCDSLPCTLHVRRGEDDPCQQETDCKPEAKRRNTLIFSNHIHNTLKQKALFALQRSLFATKSLVCDAKQGFFKSTETTTCATTTPSPLTS